MYVCTIYAYLKVFSYLDQVYQSNCLLQNYRVQGSCSTSDACANVALYSVLQCTVILILFSILEYKFTYGIFE